MEKIYTTVGVYVNGEYKMNGVKESNLLDHIQYNLQHRPGRAFFVNGVCLNEGLLSDNNSFRKGRIEEWENKLKTNPSFTLDSDTQPYI